MTFEVVVRNPLVGHVWRLMPGWNIYRSWYLGQGAFVQENAEIRRFVVAYVNETDPAVAMGNLFSATERLLRAAMKVEGVQREVLAKTLPQLLRSCVSADQRFFNILGMCCDVRSIFRLNAIRVGIEHGDHERDLRELRQSGWNPPDPDKAYLEIIANRLLGPHQQVCGIFNRVDPETGLFSKQWEPRGFAQCPLPQHDKDGRLPDEEPEPTTTPAA
jgi:hypothetical protein